MRGSLVFLGLVALPISAWAQAARPAASPTGGWTIKKSVSQMDDSKTVALSLKANSTITGWPAQTHTPTLFVRCQEGKIDVYVVTGMTPHVEEGNLDGATVLVRFDKDLASSYSTSKSTDGEALFFGDPQEMIKQLLAHNTMRFRFTPFNSSPQETWFTLRGLSVAIRPLYDGCDWSPELEQRRLEETARAEEERKARAQKEAEARKLEEEAKAAKWAEDTIEASLAELKSAETGTQSRGILSVAAVALKTPELAARAVPSLIDLLRSTSPSIRASAATTLGKIGKAARGAVPALEAIAYDRAQESSVKIAAQDALDALGAGKGRRP